MRNSSSSAMPMQACALCRRRVSRMTRHHLIPRTRHKNKKTKKVFTRKEVQEILLLDTLGQGQKLLSQLACRL